MQTSTCIIIIILERTFDWIIGIENHIYDQSHMAFETREANPLHPCQPQ